MVAAAVAERGPADVDSTARQAEYCLDVTITFGSLAVVEAYSMQAAEMLINSDV